MHTSVYKSYNMVHDQYNGHAFQILIPKNIADGAPWVWRAEFFGAFDYVDMALAEKGWHVAYYSICNMFGCDEAVSLMKDFRDFIVKEYSLSTKADIFGFSRGGLYAVNYTALYPNDVSVLYLDAPVLDVRSWPAGIGMGQYSENDWRMCKECYKLDTLDSVLQFYKNPIDIRDALIKSNIPIALCAGECDSVVPYAENGAILDKAYRTAGGDIMTLLKPHCDHHPHSISRPDPIVKFIADRRNISI